MLDWCYGKGLGLPRITQGLAGDYFTQLEGSAPTTNQALPALRHFFDVLVQCYAVPLNSFALVRGVKHSVVEGKSPEISVEQARKLLRSLDVSDVIGLRDHVCWACSPIRARASGPGLIQAPAGPDSTADR